MQKKTIMQTCSQFDSIVLTLHKYIFLFLRIYIFYVNKNDYIDMFALRQFLYKIYIFNFLKYIF